MVHHEPGMGCVRGKGLLGTGTCIWSFFETGALHGVVGGLIRVRRVIQQTQLGPWNLHDLTQAPFTACSHQCLAGQKGPLLHVVAQGPSRRRLPLLNLWPPRSPRQEEGNGGFCMMGDRSRESEGSRALMGICVCTCVCMCVPVRASVCVGKEQKQAGWPNCSALPRLSPHLAW